MYLTDRACQGFRFETIHVHTLLNSQRIDRLYCQVREGDAKCACMYMYVYTHVRTYVDTGSCLMLCSKCGMLPMYCT